MQPAINDKSMIKKNPVAKKVARLCPPHTVDRGGGPVACRCDWICGVLAGPRRAAGSEQ